LKISSIANTFKYDCVRVFCGSDAPFWYPMHGMKDRRSSKPGSLFECCTGI